MWLKIGTALLLATMVILLLPQAKNMVKHSPKAKSGDWSSFVMPITLVALLVLSLIHI